MASVEKASPSSGNTIQTKKRDFILTINEKSLPYYDEIKSYITGLKTNNYYLCCEHIGQENKHYHIYCQFSNMIKLSIKKLHGAHIETCFGSPQQNITYLKAEDEKHKKLGVKSILIDESGQVRKAGGRTIKEVKEMSIEDREELPIQYKNIVDKINMEENADIDIDDWKKEVCVVWIQGPSGIGKTEKAKKIVRKNVNIVGRKVNVVKYENGFWIGIGNAKVAIYDDFRDSHMKASEFINFIDYNKHYMNIKGGSKINNYLLIIITSVQKLENIYSNLKDEPRKQWERRIKIINMYKENDIKKPFEIDLE